MAIEWFTGFEGNSLREFDGGVSGAAVVSASGRNLSGSYCLELEGSSDYAKKRVTGRQGYYVGFRLNYDSTSRPGFVGFYSGSNLLGFCDLNANNLCVYRGTTLIASLPFGIDNAGSYLFEFYFYLNDVAGRFVVKVNGITLIDFTGDTNPGSFAEINVICFGMSNTSTYGPGYIDDIVIRTDDFPGDVRVGKAVLNASGHYTELTPSTGTNLDCINDVDDADYNYTNTVDRADSFTISAATEDIQSIQAVKVSGSARKVGGATPQNVKLLVRHSNTDDLSSDLALPTDFGVGYEKSNIWETVNGGALSEAVLNACEFGYKMVA